MKKILKTTALLLFVAILFTTVNALAQTKKNKIVQEEIAVNGNCGMCKKTIEKALDIKGIKKASWNIDTKILTVKYDASKISNADIQKTIAHVGYDTEKYKATDEAYNNLHSCCKYERK